MSQLEGQPAYVADALTLPLTRQPIIEATVPAAWQTGSVNALRPPMMWLKAPVSRFHVLAQLARPEVAELVAFLQERAGLTRSAPASG